ncbi:uncharacterized protein LOC130764654 [Actinidia eriantha]|uniref:uncharacterized protein LOC130764654 n=1 Tax=Actinidia eriantha TaxID=165200 RepID=UPI0025840B98|nr:uncharacterized protein LOC130764654 [Actinidia eriantha]
MKKYFSSVPNFGPSPSPSPSPLTTTEIVPPLVTKENQPLEIDDVPKYKEDDMIDLDEFKLDSDPDIRDQAGGETFVGKGFTNWKKKEKFDEHVGGVNSAHYQAWRKCQDLFLSNHNNEVGAVVLKNAPENLKLVSPAIQNDIVNAAAIEILNVIINDIGDECFSILIDESRAVSIKEQMAVVVRYVNAERHVIESFLGLENVTSTTAISLKEAIETLFSRHKLSISKLRRQGYDGASNMQGEFKGLKTLILNENPTAYYVHCFAHQLQLALIAVSKKHYNVSWFFNLISNVLNVVEGSCKRHDTLLEIQAAKVYKALNAGELQSGRGLNQESNLTRAYDTCWSSHYETLISFIKIFSAIYGVLEKIREDGDGDNNGMTNGLLLNIQ